jgi:hypothetical protein
MDNCNTILPNLGGKCRFNAAEIIQMILVSTYDDNGVPNKLTLSTATAKASWQAKFNIFGYAANSLSKFVPTGRIYRVIADQTDPAEVDDGGYYEKLRDGDYNITAQFNNPSPYLAAQIKKLDGKQISIYMVDANGKIIGIKEGADFYPIPLQNFGAQNYTLKSFESQAMVPIKMRLQNPQDINDLWMIELADGNANSVNDFYSLQDCTLVIGTPAVTGCVATVTLTETGDPVSGLSGSTMFGSWKFKNTATGVLTSLAATGSLTESAVNPGVYTVNESTLLTSGQSYMLQIGIAPFDIVQAIVTVP